MSKDKMNQNSIKYSIWDTNTDKSHEFLRNEL